jgi:WD40 repeat protein
VWNAKSEFCDGVLIGHDSAVMCLVQVRGGYLYSGSADSTMKMWDLTSMQCVGTITGHDNTVSTLVELSDGRLLTGSWDTTVKLWSLSKGSWSCEHTFTGHSDWITCLITLLDGRIATGSLDHTVRVWSLDSRTCDLVFNVHDIVFALTEVAQENRVFCCLGSGSIKKLDTLTGESIFYCVRDLAPFTVEARCSMVLSDGRYCIGSCQSLSLWDPSNGGSMEKMLTRPFNHQWLLLHISSKDPFERGKTIIKVENFDADTVTNDLSTAEVCAFGVEGAICVCQLRDGRICAGGSHGTVQIWS